MKHAPYLMWSLILVIVTLSACLEQSEGCLDVLASNFDVEATDDCCCEYPELTLNFNHLYGKENFTLGDSLVNALGQAFRVLDFAFYVSDVQVQQEGRWFSVNDSTTYALSSGMSLTDYDDIIAITRNQFSYPIGTLRQSGLFQGLRLSLGLTSPQATAVFESLEEDHVLRSNADLYDASSTTFRDLAVEMVVEADTITVALPAGADFAPIVFSTDKEKARGFDLNYSLQIDYREWFHTLDLSQTDQIATQLQGNLNSSIALVE